MFCTKCGKRHGDADRYCTFCGAFIEVDEPKKINTPPMETEFDLKRSEPEASPVEAEFDLKRSEPEASPVEAEFDLKRSELKSAPATQPAVSFVQPVASPLAPSGEDKEALSFGKSKAILSTVFAGISFLLLFVGWFNWVLFVSIVPASVVGLVFGIKSIGAFKEMSRQGRPRPIATLVMGVVGVVLSALSLFIFGIYTMLFFFALLEMF